MNSCSLCTIVIVTVCLCASAAFMQGTRVFHKNNHTHVRHSVRNRLDSYKLLRQCYCHIMFCAHVWQECGNNAMSSRHSAINKIIRFVFAPTSSSPSVCAQARCFMNRTCQQLNKLSSFRKTSYEFRRLCLRHRRCHHVSAQAHRVRQQRFKNNNEFTPFHQT